jgi:hypothetical protein
MGILAGKGERGMLPGNAFLNEDGEWTVENGSNPEKKGKDRINRIMQNIF